MLRISKFNNPHINQCVLKMGAKVVKPEERDVSLLEKDVSNFENTKNQTITEV